MAASPKSTCHTSPRFAVGMRLFVLVIFLERAVGGDDQVGIGQVAVAVLIEERAFAFAVEPINVGGKLLQLGVGDDRDTNAESAGALDEMEETVVVEVKLSDDELGAGIHFIFETRKVGVEVGGFGMFLGVAGAAETEAVAEFVAKMPDEVDGVL